MATIPVQMSTPCLSAKKRLQNSMLENESKSPRLSGVSTESTFKFMQTIDNRFEKQSEHLQALLQKLFRECEERILSELDKKLNTIKDELKIVTDRVVKLETVTEGIASMKEEINTLKTQIKQQENNTVSCDLRISSIPFDKNENLSEMFCNICETINISMPAVKYIYRLQNQNNKNKNNSPDAAIIVKMWSPYDKNFFLKSLAIFKKNNKNFCFNLSHVGFDSNSKFYINESLIKSNYIILQAASRLKRQKILHSAFSMRGWVFVKKTADAQLVRVDDMEQLNCFFLVSADAQYAVDDNHVVDST